MKARGMFGQGRKGKKGAHTGGLIHFFAKESVGALLLSVRRARQSASVPAEWSEEAREFPCRPSLEPRTPSLRPAHHRQRLERPFEAYDCGLAGGGVLSSCFFLSVVFEAPFCSLLTGF